LPGMIVEWFRATLETPSRKPAAAAASRASAETRFLDLTDQPGGISKAAEMYADARRKDPQARLFDEVVVNRIGYEHLQTGDPKGAIEILKLNVIAYPNSANVYDSLSDAYLADGQKDLARENAKKALELLPSDTTDPVEFREGIKASSEQKLKQLGDAPQ
jgi:tetratricopeptide (TPR) repeat protein